MAPVAVDFLNAGCPLADLDCGTRYAELSLPDNQSWDMDGDHRWGEDEDPIDFYAEVNVGRIPWTEEMIAVATKFPNVYIDTSAYVPKRYPPALVDYMKAHGRNKVMFGTVGGHRGYFEGAIAGFAQAEATWPGWLSKLLTHPIKGLENYEELLGALFEAKNAVKVYMIVSEGKDHGDL